MQRARTLHAQNCSTFVPPPLGSGECNSFLDIFAWLRAHCATHSAFTYHDGESVRTISWGDFIQATRAAARIVTEKVFQGDAPAPSSGGPKVVIGILAITGRSVLNSTSSHYLLLLRLLDIYVYYALLFGIVMAGCRAVAISSRCSAQATAHILFESKAKYLYISEDTAVQRLAASARAQVQELASRTPQSPIYATSSAAASSSGIVQLQLPNYTALYNAYDDGDIHFQQRLDTIASLTRRSDVAFILHTSGRTLIIVESVP
jgi:acyl-CoA synthetase (AMP-forming)/AMP-acid ligase II